MLGKLRFTSHVVGIGLVALSLAVPAGAAGPSKAARNEAGKRLVDTVNKISLQVPEGWHAAVPSPAAKAGIVTLTNYKPLSPDQPESSLPEDAIKIGIQVIPRGGLSLKSWNAGHIRSLAAEDSFATFETGEVVPYKLARRPALAYTIHGEGRAASVGISVEWSRDQVLKATIHPADSPALGWALAVLDSLNLAEVGQADRRREQKRVGRRESGDLVEPIEALIRRLPSGSGVIVAEAGSCPAGTFDMGEAQDSPTAFPLSLPFASGSWEVGNIGSYFGNGLHCNSNNDYYATDWNRRNANCTSGYSEDHGQEVRPMASGKVTRADCNNDPGYGCQVEVTHSVDGYYFRSRYAHLDYLDVSVNEEVTTATSLGPVGCTGLSSCGPHLHLSLLQSFDGTNYHSKCNGPASRTTCPNGEAKSGTQTRKPSPMLTAAGSSALVDGGCYTVGGGTPAWTQTIDNTDPSCSLDGPSQYWYPVSGYGQNGSMHYTWNSQSVGSNSVAWYFNIPAAGNYKIQVFIPSNHATTTSARYQINNGSVWTGPYVVNQDNYYNQWVDLTTIWLPAGIRTLYLSDVTGEATGTRKVGVDAARAIRQ